MKQETRKRVDNMSMRNFMIVMTVIGLVVVPILWLKGYLTWAIAISLFVAMLVLEAALIDLPGLTYTQINKLWGKGKQKQDGEGQEPEPDSSTGTSA